MRPVFPLGLLAAVVCAVAPSVASAQAGYLLSIPDLVATPGEQIEPEFIFDHSGPEVVGWSFGVCHETANLDLQQVFDGDLVLSLNGGAGPDFNTVDLYSNGWTVGLVISFIGTEVVFPGSYQLNTATYDVLGPDGALTELTYCTTLGAPAVGVVIVDVSGGANVPSTIPGIIDMGGPPPPPAGPFFKRGDVNGDGTFGGLADGLAILNFQFVPGSVVPPCLDAADADDSGTISGLVDGLLILNHQFIPGSPPPAPPGPVNCGTDPTDDPLGCETEPDVCT